MSFEIEPSVGRESSARGSIDDAYEGTLKPVVVGQDWDPRSDVSASLLSSTTALVDKDGPVAMLGG